MKPRHIDEYVGRRVRLRRAAAGVRQADLAQYLNMTFQQIQKYEGGENRIPASRLAVIAEALDVPVDFFFAGLGAPEGTDADDQDRVMAFAGSRQGIALNRAFARIADPGTRRLVLDIIRRVAGAAAGEDREVAPGSENRAR